MDSKPPVISNGFLKTVLKKYFQKEINVLDFATTNSTLLGDNLCSRIEKIIVTYSIENKQEHQVLSAVVKYMPEDEAKSKLLCEMKFFDTEISIYSSVLPRLLTFGCQDKLSPALYYSAMEPSPILMLEDLQVLNYKLVNRRDGLDLEHCLIAIEKLAEFHAASIALKQKDSTIFLNYNQMIFRNVTPMNQFISLCYDQVIETCESIPDLQQFVGKLKLGKNKILEKIYDVHNTPTKLKVLNHGDFWTSNLLFSNDTGGKPKDVAFIDFQACCYSSPCLDLQYFLATSARISVKKEYNVILEHYFKKLVKQLALYTNIIPSRSEFYNDFRLMAYCGFAASVMSLPLIKAPQADPYFIVNHFCNKEYHLEMLHYLPFFEKLGIFDV